MQSNEKQFFISKADMHKFAGLKRQGSRYIVTRHEKDPKGTISTMQKLLPLVEQQGVVLPPCATVRTELRKCQGRKFVFDIQSACTRKRFGEVVFEQGVSSKDIDNPESSEATSGYPTKFTKLTAYKSDCELGLQCQKRKTAALSPIDGALIPAAAVASSAAVGSSASATVQPTAATASPREVVMMDINSTICNDFFEAKFKKHTEKIESKFDEFSTKLSALLSAQANKQPQPEQASPATLEPTTPANALPAPTQLLRPRRLKRQDSKLPIPARRNT